MVPPRILRARRRQFRRRGFRSIGRSRRVRVNLAVAVGTADLAVRRVDVGPAAARRVEPVVRFAAQHPVAALALPGVVHHRLAAARVRAESGVDQVAGAAQLARQLVVWFAVAARVVLAVDRRLVAADGLAAVRLRHNRSVAAHLNVEHKIISGVISAKARGLRGRHDRRLFVSTLEPPPPQEILVHRVVCQ